MPDSNTPNSDGLRPDKNGVFYNSDAISLISTGSKFLDKQFSVPANPNLQDHKTSFANDSKTYSPNYKNSSILGMLIEIT